MQVTVELDHSDKYEKLNQYDDQFDELEILSDIPQEIQWKVRATGSGKSVPVKVTAKVKDGSAGDAIVQTIIIKPEGQPKTKVFNTLLRKNDVKPVDISFPKNTVPNSQRVEVKVFGNIMANTISNINKLLKIPYGCGEQNMVNFAPAIFIYKYLRDTNQLTDIIREQSLDIIQSGYQRELIYRHKNGGFSAFGEDSWAKDRPSTLLSSFVLKCFLAANTLMDKKTIDDTIIEKEINFIKSTFNDRTNHFEEHGRVFSSALMGDFKKNGNIATTAYTLIPLVESEINDDTGIVGQALNQLENNFENVKDIHTLALITYCLTAGGREKGKDALKQLQQQSVTKSSETIVWEETKWGRKIVSVEVAAYALLSYMHNKVSFDEVDACGLQIFRGITEQLSEYGGFQSTQDTVIGIQAMAKYGTFLVDNDMNMTIDFNSMETSSSNNISFAPITNKNADIVQIQQIEGFGNGHARVSSSGSGSVFTQIIQHYNVLNATQKAFKITFETKFENADNICMVVMAKANSVNDGDVLDGMTLLMIEHPSGFEYLSNNPATDNSTPEKVESDEEKTTFYYNDMKVEKKIEICMKKINDVTNLKPIFITVQAGVFKITSN